MTMMISSSPSTHSTPSTVDYDSILTAVDSNCINRSEQYKIGSGMPDRDVAMVGRSYAISNDDYVTGGMIVLFLVLAAIVHRGGNTLLYKIKDFFSSKRQYSDESVNDNSGDVWMVFMLVAIASLCVSLVFFDHLADRYGFDPELHIPYWVLAAGFAVTMALVYAKAWLYTLVNWVFFDSESNKKWIRSYFLLTSLTAFVLYPLSLFDVFFENSLQIVMWCTLFLLVLYELLLFYRLLVNFKSKKYGTLLIFLYFCSVEVLPTIVLWNLSSWASDSFIVKNIVY